jgi:hypothetical protein
MISSWIMWPGARLGNLDRIAIGVALVVAIAGPVSRVRGAGEVELSVMDGGTGEPVAARMELLGPRGRPIVPRGAPAWQGHFALDGKVRLQLPGGICRFTIQRGYEYRSIDGHFEVGRQAEDSKLITLRRFVDMADEGWWSADLDVRRPVRDLPMLMLSEDLHVAWLGGPEAADTQRQTTAPGEQAAGWKPVGRVRGYDVCVWRGPPECGALMIAHPTAPLDIAALQSNTDDALQLAQAARTQNAYVCAMAPYDWDFATLAGLQLVDGVAVLNHHMGPGGQAPDAEGYRPGRIRYPPPRGLGRWAQHIYFNLLESGLRLPPVAGSGSGESPSPVGYNRVYAHVAEEFTYAAWWEAMEAGRVMVTNGPLLRPQVNEQLPGHVFRGDAGESIVLQPTLSLSTRFPVEYLEVIQNGQVIHEVRLEDLASKQGRLPSVEFTASGWMTVRAVTIEAGSYQYALSGPYYVQIGPERRVSRRAAQFFLDWVYQRARQIHASVPADQRAQRLEPHRRARDYWRRLVDQANAD